MHLLGLKTLTTGLAKCSHVGCYRASQPSAAGGGMRGTKGSNLPIPTSHHVTAQARQSPGVVCTSLGGVAFISYQFGFPISDYLTIW